MRHLLIIFVFLAMASRSDVPAIRYQWQVPQYMLLESGGFFLLEDGGRLIL